MGWKIWTDAKANILDKFLLDNPSHSKDSAHASKYVHTAQH